MPLPSKHDADVSRHQRLASRIATTLLGAAGCTVLVAPAHAYLDPGTGSIILQSILAGIAVGMGLMRYHWQRFKSFLATLTGPRKTGEPESEAAHTDTDSL